MVAWYVNRLESGKMNFNKVGSKWKNEVLEQLQKDGYTVNEDGTVTKEEKES